MTSNSTGGSKTKSTTGSRAASGGKAGDSVQHLDDVEMAAWRTFIETYNDLINTLQSDLEPTGLALGDYQVLVTLSEAENKSMRMCDLAEVLQLTPSGATRRLDGLVKAGWVERRNSDVDRRVMLAMLTPSGWDKLHEAFVPHVQSVREHLIDLIDRDEMKALASIFGKVRGHLDSRK